MNKKILKFLIIFVFFFLTGFALAQERKLEVEYPEIFGIKPETVKIGLPEYIKYIYNFAILVSGLIILASLIIGGIKYLTSFGQVMKLKEAREQITSAFLGIIILLSSYLILTTINPQLVIFEFPTLAPIKKVEVPPPPPPEAEEISLISLEIPYGQQIKNGIWEKEWRKKIEDLLEKDKEFFEKERKLKTSAEEGEIVFERISDLNRYLKSLTEKCQCDAVQTLCTEPRNFCIPVGCFGDPCKEVRAKINKVMEVNQSEFKTILDFQKKISQEKKKVAKELDLFSDIENEMISCQEETKYLYSLNEYLSILNFLGKQGWKSKRITIPNDPPSKGDHLTFYCSVGGTIFDYPYYLGLGAAPEIPTELEMPELPVEEVGIKRINCPVEFPLGEIVDQLRELAVLLLFKLEKLTNLHQEMASEIEKMQELVSECNNKSCKIQCHCIPNPCYSNPYCGPASSSPCLQCIGACSGEACPRTKIDETLKKIEQIEDEIFPNLKEIKPIFSKVAPLLKSEEDPRNLENIKEKISLCYSSEFEEPSWVLLNCQSAIGNYGPGGEIIEACHPRNFYCCTPRDLTFPGETIPRPEGVVYRVPTEKYEPLPAEDNCPKGWRCDDDVKRYNQYNDASKPLKEFLSCMRKVLDNIQKEKEIKKTIGRISSISDSKLYKGTCNWLTGPTKVGGCSHLYEIKYGKEKVSAHYGGPNCRHEKVSYAVDIGDEENFRNIDITEVVKKCDPGAFINNEGNHIHISVSQARQCGAQ